MKWRMRVTVLVSVWVWMGIIGAEAGVRVVATTPLLAAIVSEVGGGCVEVVSLVGGDVDPHSFRPSPRDLALMAEADLVVANGLGYENYLDALEGGREIFRAEDVIEVREGGGCGDGHSHEGHHHLSSSDPHWWHGIRQTQRVAGAIAERLAGVDPGNEAVYAGRAAAFQERLDALSRWCRTEVARIPREARILITSHDAFGYMADELGFRTMPVRGVGPGQSPSSKGVGEVVDRIRESGVQAVFIEDFANPKVLREITSSTGARVGGRLYAESPGAAGGYEEMIRQNIRTIVDGLAPEGDRP